MMVILKLLGLFSILAMAQAYPVNFTVQTAGPVPGDAGGTLDAWIPVNASGDIRGLCAFERENCPPPPKLGAQCPQCDANGNFLPKQCSSSTGYCWCVNVITGELIPNTTVPPGHPPPNCGPFTEEDSDSDSSSSEESSSKDKSDSSSSEETKEEKDSESSNSDESKKTEDGSDSSSSEETKEEKDSGSSSSDESKKEKDGSDSSSSEETKEEKDSDSSSSEETKEEKDSDSSSSDESKKHKEESDSSSSEETKEEKDSDSSSSEETKEEKDSGSSSSEKTKEEKDSSSSEETKEDKESDSTSSSEEDSGCPDNWTRFGQQCFIFINSPKSWAEAQSYCQFDGSNLASVHSYEENHFLQSLTRGDSHHFPQTWIGGTDTMHLGLWTWSDGSKFLYENWSDHGKDGESERCLKINYHYDLKWTAARCAESLPFICSKNAEKENEA